MTHIVKKSDLRVQHDYDMLLVLKYQNQIHREIKLSLKNEL